MPLIILQTLINAPVSKCFDLSRDIGMHTDSMKHTKEKAIAGRMEGLIELGETVTWRAVHFWVSQKLTVKITKMDPPDSFTDEMVKGAFSYMKHEHLFEERGEGTLMTDRFEYKAPLGILGRVAEMLFLNRYMRKLLETRNLVIKQIAEKEF